MRSSFPPSSSPQEAWGNDRGTKSIWPAVYAVGSRTLAVQADKQALPVQTTFPCTQQQQKLYLLCLTEAAPLSLGLILQQMLQIRLQLQQVPRSHMQQVMQIQIQRTQDKQLNHSEP